MSTAIAEREAEVSVISIRDSIFCVDNISGVGFLTSKEKAVTKNDPANRPRNTSYFSFRSSLTLAPFILQHQIPFISLNVFALTSQRSLFIRS